MLSTPKEKRKSINLEEKAPFINFYQNKAIETAKIEVPMMKLMERMPPIELRAEVLFFVEKEFGWNKGKNIEFKKGSSNGSGTATGTCKDCNNFKIVFKNTTGSDGYTIRRELCRLEHLIIRADKSEVPCPCTTHVASQVM
jgi:hypothetical protein